MNLNNLQVHATICLRSGAHYNVYCGMGDTVDDALRIAGIGYAIAREDLTADCQTMGLRYWLEQAAELNDGEHIPVASITLTAIAR